MFQSVYEKKASLEDREQPFDRVKPTVRKAYERRLKRMQTPEPYVLDQEVVMEY
jgi:hypothetical protein